jgi:hypothetical protein
MAEMIPQALKLNRQACRKYVENKFSVAKMVTGYEAIYAQIIKDRIDLNGRIHAAKIQF